jgi:adenylate cyclase
MSHDIEALSQWLIEGAPSAPQPHDVLSTLCARLVACDVPLWRVVVFVRTLHPNVAAWHGDWRLGEPVRVTQMPHQAVAAALFANSPLGSVCRNGRALRCRSDGTHRRCDFSGFELLRADGVTDCWITPLVFSMGEINAASWATCEVGGFTDQQLGRIEQLLAPLARVAEIHTLRRTAINLLDTYVGHRSAERILAGAIRRGDTEAIHAAIWLSDMRGFTYLADRLPAAELVALLNRYFDCQIPAITRNGGEVLKFIGDGLLAIFPVNGTGAESCAAALAAAEEASAAVATMATAPDIALHRVRFGVALHLGEVEYGNIGGKKRLDFTCIGPAVNLAARLEQLAGRLGRTIVASSAFSRHCAPPLLPLGEFTLPGFARSETVFSVPQSRG